jgi:dCMP deaminase
MNGDQELLADAYRYARRSPDPSNQNGAIIHCRHDFVNSVGWNTFPRGVEVTQQLRNDREQKLLYIEHAERAAIYQAVKAGFSTEGATMYCPWAACHECARGIIISGIDKVVVHKERMDLTPERWKKSVDSALEMLTNAEIMVDYYSGPVYASPVIVNGSFWSPKELRFL